MGTISLKGLHFKAYHGYYDEERKKGNQFEVDITVKTTFTTSVLHDDLDGTVDYETLYGIVKAEMSIPSRLLENVVKRTVERVLKEVPAVSAVKISLSKFNPPIGGDCKKATVSLRRKRGK